MSSKTIKTGDTVTITDTGLTAVVTSIEHGRYFLNNTSYRYTAHEIVKVKDTPAPKARQAIKKSSARIPFKSERRTELDAIYSLIAPEIKKAQPWCQAKLDGCLKITTELHHMKGRTGYWLIAEKYLLPICCNCHRTITDNGDEGINRGLSLLRTVDEPVPLSKRVAELLGNSHIPLPKNYIIE